MILNDLLIFLPGVVANAISKTIKTKIPEKMKDYIEKEHLYHFTKDKATAEKIIDSRIYKKKRRNI